MVARVNGREFHLCNLHDGTCALRVDGDPVRHFTDVLEAVGYIRELPDADGATLIVYDLMGNAAFHWPL
jgi:hypothetical protein